MVPDPAHVYVLGDSGTSVLYVLGIHGSQMEPGSGAKACMRDCGSRIQSVHISSAWVSDPLTIALLMMCETWILMEWS